jgi:serine/threonine-protein kinase
MSPEQSRGERLTPASDVFSFGLVLFEMLTGRRAVSGGSVLETLRRIELFDAAPYAAQVPEPFASILRQSLVRDPIDRRISMAQIAEQLA